MAYSTSSSGSCSSISIVTSAAASRAISSVSATTAQIGSPVYITSSWASTGSSFGPTPIRHRMVYQLFGTSLAVTTVATPGKASARLVSMRRILPRATGLRTILIQSMFG